MVLSDDLAAYQAYASGEPMVAAIAAFLTKAFHATGSTEELARGSFDARIAGVPVTVFCTDHGHYATVYRERGKSTAVINRIAEQFNALLESGTYAHRFDYARPK